MQRTAFDFDVVSGPAPSRNDQPPAVGKEPAKEQPDAREAPVKQSG